MSTRDADQLKAQQKFAQVAFTRQDFQLLNKFEDIVKFNFTRFLPDEIKEILNFFIENEVASVAFI